MALPARLVPMPAGDARLHELLGPAVLTRAGLAVEPVIRVAQHLVARFIGPIARAGEQVVDVGDARADGVGHVGLRQLGLFHVGHECRSAGFTGLLPASWKR